jgi:hypothetical protein
MTEPVVLLSSGKHPWHERLTARVAAGIARVLAGQPPHRIKRILWLLRRGCGPASPQQAAASREAVVSVSVRCAGRACLQRSIATALLCRMRGNWPTWCTGVRTSPFRAHAWVEVHGQPIGETFGPGYYRPIIVVPPVEPKRLIG